MPRNIEIKARLDTPELAAAVRARALALATEPPQRLVQDDCFFALPAGRGRLKLRCEGEGEGGGEGSAELIHYLRADEAGERASDYVRVPQPDPKACREALTRALGLVGRVRKTRWLCRVGRTRIHLDEVEGLGQCLELEVVMRNGEADASGIAEALDLLDRLGAAGAPRLAGSYFDELAKLGAFGGPSS